MHTILKDFDSGLDYIAVGATENPKNIVVLLHGTGDNCEGFSPLADALAKEMPETLFLVPNGLVPLSALIPPDQLAEAKEQNPTVDFDKARNWGATAAIQATTDDEMLDAVEDLMVPPRTALDALVDGQLKKYGLEDKNLAFYGFSAGGMMALYQAIGREKPCAGVISHSGHFVGVRDVASKPAVQMIFGEQEMTNQQVNDLFSASAEMLQELGLPVKTHTCKDLAHEVNQESFDVAKGFLKTALGDARVAPQPKIRQDNSIDARQERLRTTRRPKLKLRP